MNHLILNREFRLPDDGWYQIAPLGEFLHAVAGVSQVIDQEACAAMAARFSADAKAPHFPGLLIDFDHFSLDGEKRSEAAGWILGLESREDGLWAQIRWSDSGEEAVKGGRYRFLSPVWARGDCVELGNGLVRPVRLLNAAVTNDPNLKGMVPLSNSSRDPRPDGGKQAADGCVDSLRNDGGQKSMKSVIEKLVNHLGLAADATEAVILEKMAGMPALTAVTELQNSLKQAQDERDALKGTLKGVEGELVNRHLAEFEGVISDGSKAFWSEQLMTNRVGALVALTDLRTLSGKETLTPSPSTEWSGNAGTRKPLHNRATARPVPPGQGTTGPEGDSKAVKIRNRAHEIAAAEKLPFIVAFRRAERESAA